ncbi:MAG TPA: MBL fold metallo-hydrolase, partial [Xanthomonadales bacterium]|nr:MBL fold metallo-hydrolase [Xanthomonadales bacterium]
MKISKHIHSCLLIKENNKVILIDPGSYSIEDKGITLDNISVLDYLLISHEHLDHLYIPFVQELTLKFPDLIIISNEAVSKKLYAENIKVNVEGTEFIELVDTPHEHVFG